MKRSGFTMIELIFVIVILGILAAVAVPKLAATRTDAAVSKMSANLATLVNEAGAVWTARGQWPSNYSQLTNIPLYTEAGGVGAATTINNDITQADIDAVDVAFNHLDTNRTLASGGDAAAIAAVAEDGSGSLYNDWVAAVAAASIDPVYMNASSSALDESKGCYSIALGITGEVTITQLDSGVDNICTSSFRATSKTNLSGTETDGGRVHSFGATGVTY